MEPFTDAELAAIDIAISLARKVIREKGTVQAPQILDAIELKIKEVFAGDGDRWYDALMEGIGDLRYLN